MRWKPTLFSVPRGSSTVLFLRHFSKQFLSNAGNPSPSAVIPGTILVLRNVFSRTKCVLELYNRRVSLGEKNLIFEVERMRVTRKRITTRVLNLRSAEDIFIGGWAKIEFRTSLFYQLCFSSRPSKPLKLGVCSTRRRLDQFCPFVLLFSSSRGNAVENCNSVFRLNVSTDSGTKAIQACRHVPLAVTVRSFYKKAYVLSCTVVWKNNIQKNNLNARLILLWRSTKTTSDILNRCFFKDDIFQQSWKYSETKIKCRDKRRVADHFRVLIYSRTKWKLTMLNQIVFLKIGTKSML